MDLGLYIIERVFRMIVYLILVYFAIKYVRKKFEDGFPKKSLIVIMNLSMVFNLVMTPVLITSRVAYEKRLDKHVLETVEKMMCEDKAVIYEKHWKGEYTILTEKRVLDVKATKQGEITSIVTGNDVLYLKTDKKKDSVKK